MRRRSVDYHYKGCDLEEMTSLDKKRYQHLNEYGLNIDCNKKRVIDFDMLIKRARKQKTK
jgi:hypothetical protein